MNLGAIHHLLAQLGAQRPRAGLPVYDLSRSLWPPLGRARRLHDKQLQLLDALRSLDWSVYLRSGDSPLAWHPPGAWASASRDTWLVPPEPGAADLLDGPLEYGAWQLYLGAHALDPVELPDLFRGDLAEALDALRGHSVPLLVDAWHDNSDWRVALDPAAVPGLAAA